MALFSRLDQAVQRVRIILERFSVKADNREDISASSPPGTNIDRKLTGSSCSYSRNRLIMSG